MTTQAVSSPRRPAAAFLLSFFFPGLGHIYYGRFGKGLVLLFCDIFLGTLGGMAVLPVASGLRAILAVMMAASAVVWIYAMVDAFHIARKMGKSGEPYILRDYNRWYVYLMLALLMLPVSVVGALGIRGGAMEAFQVTSPSMFPTIRLDERVLVDKLAYHNGQVHRGDLVAFWNPNNRSQANIKRVVALPGDTVEIREGVVYVNGAALNRDAQGPSEFPDYPTLSGTIIWETNGAARYQILMAPTSSTAPAATSGDFPRITLAPGHCFVLGDNRDRSVDSRSYGPIPLADLLGRVTHVYFPRWQKLD